MNKQPGVLFKIRVSILVVVRARHFIISGSRVRIPYALRQGILSTIVSQPRCSKWVPGRNLFLVMLFERLYRQLG